MKQTGRIRGVGVFYIVRIFRYPFCIEIDFIEARCSDEYELRLQEVGGKNISTFLRVVTNDIEERCKKLTAYINTPMISRKFRTVVYQRSIYFAGRRTELLLMNMADLMPYNRV